VHSANTSIVFTPIVDKTLKSHNESLNAIYLISECLQSNGLNYSSSLHFENISKAIPPQQKSKASPTLFTVYGILQIFIMIAGSLYEYFHIFDVGSLLETDSMFPDYMDNKFKIRFVDYIVKRSPLQSLLIFSFIYLTSILAWLGTYHFWFMSDSLLIVLTYIGLINAESFIQRALQTTLLFFLSLPISFMIYNFIRSKFYSIYQIQLPYSLFGQASEVFASVLWEQGMEYVIWSILLVVACAFTAWNTFFYGHRCFLVLVTTYLVVSDFLVYKLVHNVRNIHRSVWPVRYFFFYSYTCSDPSTTNIFLINCLTHSSLMLVMTHIIYLLAMYNKSIYPDNYSPVSPELSAIPIPLWRKAINSLDSFDKLAFLAVWSAANSLLLLFRVCWFACYGSCTWWGTMVRFTTLKHYIS